ncbi:TPM domain-containing protein [Azonexus hydrophilus]|uniref:TPM domain-containing protein n=1 Tax=Azonexus hydrophilus TaxID=418702 RepID=UPI00040FA59D|nr:YgcG family protein [Azonexus hydrophilus]
MLRWLLLCLFALLPITGWSSGPLALPALSDRVVDLTGTLSAGDRAGLVERLTRLEQEKGAQIAVLLLPTTAPESIEQFGIRLAESWKIGRQGVDDGVIVIVAKDDRRMRIEVGYGLEGAIPDAIAKRIVDEQMAPRFRDGDFAGGLSAAVDTLVRVIDGENLPPPKEKKPESAGFDTDSLLFIAIFVASVARALFGLVGALGISLLAGALAWFSFGSLSAAVIAALITFFASFMRAGKGGWHSGGGGGSRGGGGGFSGGGGGFGGGGASGRW